MNFDLFPQQCIGDREAIGFRAYVLRGFALPYVNELLPALQALEECAVFPHMITPGRFAMSVAMTNCGRLRWMTDWRGYRYSETPIQRRVSPGRKCLVLSVAWRERLPWRPTLSVSNPMLALSTNMCRGVDYPCIKTRTSATSEAPIVSISLGMPAIFLFGGHERTDKAIRVSLIHGDVVVWGGVDRLRYHGVMSLKSNPHPLLGSQRINLTLRKAG